MRPSGEGKCCRTKHLRYGTFDENMKNDMALRRRFVGDDYRFSPKLIPLSIVLNIVDPIGSYYPFQKPDNYHNRVAASSLFTTSSPYQNSSSTFTKQ